MIILPEDKAIISILSAEDAGHVLMALVSDDESPELSAQAKIVYTVIFERNKRMSEKSENKAIRDSAEYRRWRKCVLFRDNYTCQHCGTIDGILHVHHLKRFINNVNLRMNVDNGITLCKECHISLHVQEGW